MRLRHNIEYSLGQWAMGEAAGMAQAEALVEKCKCGHLYEDHELALHAPSRCFECDCKGFEKRK